MTFALFGIKIKVHFLFTVVVSLLLYMDRQGAMAYSLLSVVIHEWGHLAVLLALRSPPKSISLCPCGILMDGVQILPTSQKILVAMGGPILNILPALFLPSSLFKTAMLINGLFNLLPLSGTDGGDILSMLCYETDCRFLRLTLIFLQVLFALAIFFCGAWIFAQSLNPTLLAASIYIVVMLLSSRN